MNSQDISRNRSESTDSMEDAAGRDKGDEGFALAIDQENGSVRDLNRASARSLSFSQSKSDVSAKFESLDFDPVENSIFSKEWRARTVKSFTLENIGRWLVCLVIGVLIGLLAFGINAGTTSIARYKFALIKYTVDNCDNVCLALPFVGYAGINLGLVLVAAILGSYVEPNASGSGIPDVKCYLNGIKVPRVVRLKTLIAKAVGVLCSVSGGIACGAEGPMIHCGSIIAAGVSQGKSTSLKILNSNFLKNLRCDHEKRDFVSCGAAAGVAAAFGAPVGGVLFALEEGSSFWNQALTWRVFFTSMVSTFTLNFFLSGYDGGKWGDLTQPGLVNFGTFAGQTGEGVNEPGYTVLHLPFFAAVGICGGLFGALFVFLTKAQAKLRLRFTPVSRPSLRCLEAVLLTLVTSSASLLCAFYLKDCVPKDPTNKVPMDEFSYWCPAGQYNNMATIFFTSYEDAIRNLFHYEGKHEYDAATLAIFFVVFFLLTTWTYGSAVPAGLFVPSILSGCAFGRLCGVGLKAAWPELGVDPGVFALMGAAAMLAGKMRMTLSLTVMLIEATNDVTYGLPIMMTVMVAKWVGDLLTLGVYDTSIELGKVPFLEWEPPILMRKFRAVNVMSQHVYHFREIERVGTIVQVLRKTKHQGFPVVGGDNKFSGLILRSQLITLLEMRMFRLTSESIDMRTRPVLEDFKEHYPRYIDIDRVPISTEEENLFIDLLPYVNTSYICQHQMPLNRVFRLFRTMGMRHLVVVDRRNEVVGIITRKDLTHMEKRLVRQRLASEVAVRHGFR